MLDLTNNCIADWGEIRRLGGLPSLTSLNISSNQLQELTSPLPTGMLLEIAALILRIAVLHVD